MKASISKINCANDCLRKYKYKYVDELEKILKSSKPQLGVIGHQSLEHYFKGGDWTAPIAKYEGELRLLMEEEQALYAHIPSELYRMVRGYLQHWRKHDTGVEVLAVEKSFSMKTPGGNTYEGIIDLIYKDSEGTWVEDHKFVKAIPNEAVRYLDAQTNLYFTAAQDMGYDPTGVVFDYVRTKPPSVPKVLKSGLVSTAACDTDVATYLGVVKSAGLDPKDYMAKLEELQLNVFYKRSRVPRPGKLAQNIMEDFDSTCSLLEGVEVRVREGGNVPRSMGMDCSWKCEFKDLCFAELAGQDTSYMLSADFQPKTKREESVIDYGSIDE